MKILIYADAGQPTGFAKITKNLANNLAVNHEVMIAGIGYFGQPGMADSNVTIFPATLDPTKDFMGLRYIEMNMKKYNPDIILIIQDIWNAMPLAMKIREFSNIPMMLYTMPDSPNIKWIYGLSLTMYDTVICPTNFGINELACSVRAAIKHIDLDKDTNYDTLNLNNGGLSLPVRLDMLRKYQNIYGYDLVSVGCANKHNHNIIPKEDARKAFNIPNDKNIILNVNTNSFRKRIDLTLVGFKKLLNISKNHHLVLHCQGGQETGWDIPQLISLFEIEKDQVTYLTKPLSEADLSVLYSTADVMVNTSAGEGWGMPAIEGYLHGIPQLVPNWSATREIWNPAARIITRPDRFHYSNINTLHGRIDTEDFVDRVNDPLNYSKCIPAIPLISWHNMANFFDNLITTNINTQAEPMSINDVLSWQTGYVESKALSILEGY